MVPKLTKKRTQCRVIRRDEIVSREIEQHIVSNRDLARVRQISRLHIARIRQRLKLPPAHQHEQLARPLRHRRQHMHSRRLRHLRTSTSTSASSSASSHHRARPLRPSTTAPRTSSAQRRRVRAGELSIIRRERSKVMPHPAARQHLRRRPQQRRAHDMVDRRGKLHALQRGERPQQRARLARRRTQRRRVDIVHHDQHHHPPLLPSRGRGRGRGGEELREAGDALGCTGELRERGEDVAWGEGGVEGVEDEDVCACAGGAGVGEGVEHVAFGAEAVEEEVEAGGELEEVAREVRAVGVL